MAKKDKLVTEDSSVDPSADLNQTEQEQPAEQPETTDPPAEQDLAVEEGTPNGGVSQIEPAPEEDKASKVVDPEADSDTIYGGDTVMLKSGGAKMKVDAAFDTPVGRKAHCSWQVAGKYNGETYSIEVLHKLKGQ